MCVTICAIPPICRNWQNAYIISLSKELEALESQVLWCIQGIAHQVRRKNWLHKSYNCLPARPSYDEQYLHITNVGAFTALYGTTARLGDRLRALPIVAIGFVTASLLGILCSANAWLNVACLVVVATVACIIVFGVGLGPPGPMQFVLVAGVSGHLVARVPSLDAFAIPALVAVGALSAYLIVIALSALPLMRNRSIGMSCCG
jgi:hypothetical protein